MRIAGQHGTVHRLEREIERFGCRRKTGEVSDKQQPSPAAKVPKRAQEAKQAMPRVDHLGSGGGRVDVAQPARLATLHFLRTIDVDSGRAC